MPFWDRFVLWVYLGLADVFPAGRHAISRLFERTHSAGRLNLGDLNDLSILLLASSCRRGLPVRLEAEAEILHRNLSTQYVRIRTLQDKLHEPRLTEVLELNRPHRLISAQLLAGVLTVLPGHEFWLNLAEFWSKINALGLVTARAKAMWILFGAVKKYYSFPIGTVSFQSLLFRHACGYLGLGARPLPVPDPSSSWPIVEDETERLFLTRCGELLSDTDRVMLFLHFYGRLTAENLAGMLRFADPDWTADRVVVEVERCWAALI